MPRPYPLLASALGAFLAVGCGAGDAPPIDLASPSAGCDEAFVEAAEAGERAGAESPRSPSIDALTATLDACASADEWMTALRGHAAALPLELDRETALDELCADHADTAVCEDWTSSGSGAGRAEDPGAPSPTG